MKERLHFISGWEIIICLFCLGLALLLFETGFFARGWEDFILTTRFFGRGKVQYQEPIIIKIEEESIHTLGSWPWPRKLYAEALRRLDREGAAVVGLDLFFQEPDPKNDPILAQALEELQTPVVLGTELDLKSIYRFGGRRWLDHGEQFSLFPMADKGYLNLLRDDDGLLRKWPLYSNAAQHCFAERLYYLATGKSPPSPGHARACLSFLGGQGAFPTLSFSQLIKGEYADGFFRGKVVLIGVTGKNIDRHSVAVQALGALPGVYIQAYLFRNLLEKSWLEYLPNWIFIPLVTWFSLCWAILLRSRVGLGLFLLNLGAIFLIIVVGIILGFFGYLFPVVSMIGLVVCEAVFLLARSFQKEMKERYKLKSLFAKYVSPQILEEILSRRNEINVGGERRFVAVLFADMRGFMRFAEEHDPEEVVSGINQVLGETTEIILRHGGLVDKYLGDGLMAVFGIPAWDDSLFKQAFAACQEIVNAKITRGDKEFAIGIGLAWGDVVAGSVGNGERLEYTIMGTPVNLASRLEKLAGPGEIVFPFEPGRNYPLTEGAYSLEEAQIKGMKNPLLVGRVKRVR